MRVISLSQYIVVSVAAVAGLASILRPEITHAAVSLPVPFTMQAPYSQWGVQPWEDACEEAVIIMVDHFYSGVRTAKLPPATAASSIMHVVRLENNHFGFNKDTNAAQMVEIINNFFRWEAREVPDPTIEMIKAEIDAGRPVIVPFHGKAVYNPYFRGAGPDYHTAVIKGYDDATKDFIVQEPGNGWGLDYRYSYATLMDAMHDFLPSNNTKNGKKVAVFTSPSMSDLSAQADGDNDGLSKQDELVHGSILWLTDSDGDGFTDGEEITFGYSPTINENTLGQGSLVKLLEDPKVYLLDNGLRRHILNEQVFLSHGWKWSDIHVVGTTFFQKYPAGNPVQ